jgi:ribose/xylose/arabinose/galactoside ABC-type transport system permease subunit
MTTQRRRFLADPSVRPFLLFVLVTLMLGLLDGYRGRVLSVNTAYSVLQQLATIGPVALALGLSMMIKEFDLSVGGMLSLAGCLAVVAGQTNPYLGLLVAAIIGLASGLIQGTVIVMLGLSSIGVTLGGLLSLGGIAYVLTGNATIAYERMDVAMAVNAPLLNIFSVRSLLAIGMFATATVLVSWTRAGRDLIAVGSDRRAATTAGLRVNHFIIAVFAISGVLTALAGGLLSYGLAAASPVALADTLVPGATAAILGGVSLAGGKGRPLGIAGGVLVLAMLRSGLTALGVPPYVHWIVTGMVLLAVAIFDGEDLRRRTYALRGARIER